VPKQNAQLAIVGAEIYTPFARFFPGTIVLDGDRIAAVGPEPSTAVPPEAKRREARGLTLVPGYLDLHMHGRAGVDALASDPGVVRKIAAALPETGVTGFLAGLISAPLDDLRAALQAISRAGDFPGARLLGVHLEGPYLNPDYKGAHPREYLREPADGAYRDLVSEFPALIRAVTVAPELPGGMEMIAWLRERGIVVWLGHSGATYEQAEAAIAAGARVITHTFNAMVPFRHREPGLVGAALTDDRVYAEVIADLIHVHPATIRLVVRAKGPSRVMLVTDSMAGAGLPDGRYRLGDHEVTVRGGEARLEDGTLAGSTLRLDRAVANTLEAAGLSFPQALPMVTANPAQVLGTEEYGELRPGAAADLLLLREGKIETVIIRGQVAWES